MRKSHNYEQIRDLYQKGYQEAIKDNNRKLPTYVENWPETLNEIEFKFFSDIKNIGLLLFPYYPIENFFADFANPFEKIVVVIIYKNSDKTELENRVSCFKKHEYIVYTIDSKSVTYTAEELYKKVAVNRAIDFFELDITDFNEFIEHYKDRNSQCLLYSIKENHFKRNNQLFDIDEVQ